MKRDETPDRIGNPQKMCGQCVQLTESDRDQWRSWQLELELPLHCTEDTVECRTMASGRRSVLRTCDTHAPTRTLEIRAAGLGVLKAAS